MERCATHGFLNCKCQETLSAYLARQFRESGSDRVDRDKLGFDHQPHGRVGVGRNSGNVGGETKR